MHKAVHICHCGFCAFDFRFFRKEERGALSYEDGLTWSQKGMWSDPQYSGENFVNTPSQEGRDPRNSTPTVKGYLVQQCTGNCRALTSLVLKTLMGKSATTFPWARLSDWMRAFVCTRSTADGISGKELCHASSHNLFLPSKSTKKDTRYMVFLFPYLSEKKGGGAWTWPLNTKSAFHFRIVFSQWRLIKRRCYWT